MEKESLIFQFNVNNYEGIRDILHISKELNKPVILGFSETSIAYFGGYSIVCNLVNNLVNELNISIPITIHLDHGSYEACFKAIDAGFSSLMYDGSYLSLTDNIENTKAVVAYAKLKDVLVEGELGIIGTSVDSNSYTSLEDSIKYVNATGIDFLAPAVGNAHGLYKGKPNINFDLIKDLKSSLNVSLVLHGGSDLSLDILKECVEAGINKININTDLQIVWTNAIRAYLNNEIEVHDPRKIINAGQVAFKNKIKEYLNILN